MKPIVVVGSLNMDLVVQVAKLPLPGETVFGQTFATYPGGKGANQAVAAAKCGGKVFFAGSVGNDSFGQDLKQALVEAGLEPKFIQTVQLPTGTALITVASEGKNSIVVVPGANEATSKEQVDYVLNEAGPKGILLVQHEVPAATVHYAIQQAAQLGYVVIVNPAPARLIPTELCPYIDWLTPNETELEVLTGQKVESAQTAQAAAQQLLEAGVKSVLVTLGREGALYMNNNQVIFQKAWTVKAVDTTAAGDAFNGALAVALGEEKSLTEAFQFASACAALSVTRAGAQPALPWREEIQSFLKERSVQYE